MRDRNQTEGDVSGAPGRDAVSRLRERLEAAQIRIYLVAIVLAVAAALTEPGTTALEPCIAPALAAMLFVTFLQVPLRDLGRSFSRRRFLSALFLTNFVLLPMLVACLIPVLPADRMLRLGVLMVLLTPCIDYVVAFAHLGGADAKALLAATPALLLAQIVLLPVYLTLFLGEEAAGLVQAGPFVHAFVWMIAGPLALAACLQVWSRRSRTGRWVGDALGYLPVPATALVLFVVIAAVLPRLGPALGAAWRVVPIYVGFALAAPSLGWAVGRLFRLDAASGRALAFSAGTRNSLVVLPLALGVPGAIPLLPAVIVAQTLVELAGAMLYVRVLPKLGRRSGSQPPADRT